MPTNSISPNYKTTTLHSNGDIKTIISNKQNHMADNSIDSLETPIASPARSSPSITSSIISPTATRRHFDQRLQSRISLSQSLSKIKLQNDATPSRSRAESVITSLYYETPNAMKWMTMKKLSEELYSRDFRIQYGEVTCMIPGDGIIAFGTHKGHIVLFNYQQEFMEELGSRTIAVEQGPITTIALSLDSTYVATGYKSGHIFIWDANIKTRPILHIPPVTPKEIAKSSPSHNASSSPTSLAGLSNRREGHMEGIPITQLMFVGLRHTAIISSDEIGMMVSHNGGRSMMSYYIKSKIILGKYQLPTGIIDYSNTLLSYSSLPIGSSQQLTDSMGVMTIITPSALIVISTTPQLQTHFKVGKPKIIKESLGLSGCTCWFPATVNRSEGTYNLPMLAYCWTNVLTLFEVSSESITDSHGVESTILKFENKKRWACLESIVALQWVSSKIISVLTISQRLIFINRETLKVMFTIDVMSKHIKHREVYLNNQLDLVTKDYSNVFKTFKGKVFIMGKYEFFIGSLTNWADKLFDSLKSGNYVEALEEARKQYEGTCDLTLVGLPGNDELRHSMVYDHIIEILDASLNYVFTDEAVLRASSEEREQLFTSFLSTALNVCITTNASPDVYENLFDKFANSELEILFFDVLEPFILKDLIVTLPPIILKSMVEVYTSQSKGEVLEELICLLDIKQLDIDLTIQLCESNQLMDTLVYIWNTLMFDYITPLFDAIKVLKDLTFKPETFSESELQSMRERTNYIYPYLSYILTGRQYPSDKPVDFERLESSKLNMYYTLFNGAAISWPKGTAKLHILDDDIENEPAFPYLYTLLKYDSAQMFACLNEVFEDELLNDDEILAFSSSTDNYELKVNRQYIVDVLLGMFDQNDGSSDLTIEDQTYLFIFIARNYPKYFQFIRLSDSTLNGIVESLCSYPTLDLKDDCELSIQSLFSVYKPVDFDSMIPMFESAGFYNALLSVYNSENKALQLLKLWLKPPAPQEQHIKETETETSSGLENPFLETSDDSTMNTSSSYGAFGMSEIFESVPSMVQKCFDASKSNISERLQVEKFIKENFDRFIKDQPTEMCEVFSLNCPSLNNEVLNTKAANCKYLYLSALIDLESKGLLNFSVQEELKLEYINSLIQFNKSELKHYVLSLNTVSYSILLILKERDELDILVSIYEKENQYELAISEIIGVVNKIGTKLIKSGKYDKALEDKLWEYLFLGFKILENTKLDDTFDDSGLTMNESLLLQLVESTVKLFVSANKEVLKSAEEGEDHDNKSKVLSVFKRYIQDSFTNLINIKNDASDSFLAIFNEFLSRSSVKITTLGDVRPVLNEIFLAYSHEEIILEIILKLVNEDIYKDLIKLENMKLSGWSLMHLDCEVCGKNIWGSGINSNNFEVWQDFKLKPLKHNMDPAVELLVSGKEEEDDIVKDTDSEPLLIRSLEIMVFQCKHGYHTKCLDSMGMSNTEKSCILCNDK